MKRTSVAACLLTLLAISSSALAIDRSAKNIDTLWFEAAGYKDINVVAATLTVENLLAAKREDWAILAQLSIGEWDFDVGGQDQTWMAGLGLKWYLLPVTSISLVGSYRAFDEGDSDITAGTATLKQRLAPASFAISPYIFGSASLQSADFGEGVLDSDDESFTEVIFTAGAGVDFMANDEFAFVFQGGFSESDGLNGGDQYADGFFVGVGMQYYWF